MWAGELFDLLQYIRRILEVQMLEMPGRSDRLEPHTVKNLHIQNCQWKEYEQIWLACVIILKVTQMHMYRYDHKSKKTWGSL